MIFNYLLFWYQQTIRRLAQNREAARKSRLRKKVMFWASATWKLKLFAVTFSCSWQLFCQCAIGLYSAAWEQQAEAISDGTGHAASPFPGILSNLLFWAFWYKLTIWIHEIWKVVYFSRACFLVEFQVQTPAQVLNLILISQRSRQCLCIYSFCLHVHRS